MEAVETALEVHKVLNDNLEVVDDDGERINNEGVEVQDSVEEMVKIDQASAAPDMATMTGQACHHIFHNKCYIQ